MDEFQMRKPCHKCGSESGRIETRGSLDRASARCEQCGANDRELHVSHIISVNVGKAMGLTDEELDHEENLAALCDECNLGMGDMPMSLRLAMKILRARIWFDMQKRKRDASGNLFGEDPGVPQGCAELGRLEGS